MGSLGQDIKYGLRMLGRNPGFATMAILILALGIGANTAIFSVLNAFMLRPLPYDKAEELVSIYENEPNQHIDRFGAAGPKYLDWRKENTVFQEMVRGGGVHPGADRVRRAGPGSNVPSDAELPPDASTGGRFSAGSLRRTRTRRAGTSWSS